MQQGTVFERSGMWYLQYWRTDFVNGADKKRRITEMRKNISISHSWAIHLTAERLIKSGKMPSLEEACAAVQKS